MARFLSILFICLANASFLFATQSSQETLPLDSTSRKAPAPSVSEFYIETKGDSLQISLDSIVEAQEKAQTVATPTSTSKRQTEEYFKPDPKRATWYALVCPGLGQIYNRSYWKLPVLYGGILTFTYLISWNGGMYNDYHNAYHDILDDDPATDSYLNFYPSYDGTQSWLQTTLKSKTKRYRRARDLSTFGLVAFYMVSVIDAFVDAHLYDFSVTDDLSFHWEPVINTYGLGNSWDAKQSPVVGIQCSLQFK